MKQLIAFLSLALVCGAQNVEEIVSLEPLEPTLVLPEVTSPEEVVSFESLDIALPSSEEIATLEPLEFEPTLTLPGAVSAEEFALPAPQLDIPRKTPFLAVGLSYLFPGLGHVYLGDMRTGGALMGSAGTSIGLIPVTAKSDRSLATNLVALQSVWQYGIFAAYRDVRTYNQQSGYSYRMPTDTFSDLVSAPFSFKVLKKPEVWGGFLGTMAAAFTMGYFLAPEDAHIHLSASSHVNLPPYVAFPIGIGEEALFRGYLQSELMEGLGKWGGIAVSSLVFGAAHIPNAMLLAPEDRWRYYTFSLPLITGMGAYFGWVTEKNHSLRESVALHSWYDFTLFAAVAMASQAATTTHAPAVFALPLSF